MRLFNKRYIFLLLIVVSVLLLASCGKSNESESIEKQGDLDVVFAGEIVEADDKIIIEGESNLLEDARLNGFIIVDDDDILSETTELTDENGAYHMEFDHHQYGDAKVMIEFEFDQTMQEEEIIEHYGEGGQDLKGPFTYIDKHYDMEQVNKKAMVEVTIKTDEDTSEHEIVAPDWKERPDDYGDSRIWIEFDEIENDDDFFYIKGSSNIIEGAIITGEYTGSSGKDEVHVNPDGTFEMKIPYQYDEEAHFEVQFVPSSSGQWATIEDMYGEKGEKLVGKLVDDTGNYLQAIAIIEYNHES